MKILLSIIISLISNFVFAARLPAPADAHSDESMTSYFRSLYEKELSARNASLSITYLPHNNSSLAMARPNGGDWKIEIYGGYLDWPQGDDALKLLICHELGHLFENAIQYTKAESIEGTADYFAGNDCARRVFNDREQFLTAAEDLTKYWWNAFSHGTRGPSPSRHQTSTERLTQYIEHYHHEAQCRLDIMSAGFDCPTDHPHKCRPACWLW